MPPLLATLLAELRVTAGVFWVMFTEPVASMTMLPAVEVEMAVLVAVVIVVSARADATARAAVSRAAAAAESIKRCLINSAS
jgi:hypothetical protein